MAKNKHTNTKRFFTTLTFVEGEYDTEVEKASLELSQEFCTRFCAVKELGSYGTNPHLHIYGELKLGKRTDKITDRYKKAYKANNIFLNRYTIKTIQEKDPIYRIGHYMQKELLSEKIATKDIDWKIYNDRFNARQNLAHKLIKQPSYRRFKIDELPAAYIAYCDCNKLDRQDIICNLAKMVNDDYIQVSQFRQLKNVRIKIMLKINAEYAMDEFSELFSR